MRTPTPSILSSAFLPSIFFCLLSFNAVAQPYTITQPLINACGSAFLDSGGQGASGYSDNEYYVSTICPDNPDDAISLTFVTFNLSTQGPNADNLTIYDGNSTAAPSIGTYTGTQLQGWVASSTFFNTSGCLTVVFQSNASGTGVFAASINCFTPCLNPTAVAVMDQDMPALICVDEVVQFDGTGSFAELPFNIVSWVWDFRDGTIDSLSGPLTSHSYSEPGEYIVQLTVTDDNDCQNNNVVDLQILVSTTPSFAGTVEDHSSCLGATVDLSAVVSPVTWTGLPEANFGDGIFLEDDPGACFDNPLSFMLFDPGQTLQNANDLLSVCVSMEHSFMGDLIINIVCPNGQSMIMHQQGGGGTYLGGANDTDSNANPIPGECWEYCWSPTATNGTWVQSVAAGLLTPAGIPQSNALNAGTYTSLQPFSNLVGCPLNGIWSMQICDMWGADNGHVCSWELNFAPSIIPDATQFTPDLGTSTLDSASWVGPALTVDPNNPLEATATPSIPGNYDYIFTVTDNFGCTYDTTITITVPEPMLVDAGPDIVLCNDPVAMAGEVMNAGPSGCVWTLELNESFGDSWNGGAMVTVIIDGVSTNYTISGSNVLQQFHSLNVNAGSTIVLQYTAGSIYNYENAFSLTDDTGLNIYSSPYDPSSGIAWSGTATCGGSNLQVAHVWVPVTGLADPTDPLTTVIVTQPTWYYLSVFPEGFPECAVTDSVLVSPDPSINAGENNAFTMCANEPAFMLIDSLNGTPDAGGVWTYNGGVVADLFDPLSGNAGIYTYTVTSPNNCTATAQIDITIIPAEDPTCCGIVDAGSPSYSCDLSINLYATPGNTGVGIWTGPPGAIFQDATAPETMVTMPPGGGGTHWFYWIEDDNAFCYLIDSVEKTFTDAIIIDFALTDAVCYSYCDGTVEATITGGNVVADHIFSWSTGVGGTNSLSGLCAGEYSLSVTDDNGCEATSPFSILQPILLEIDSTASHPVTCSGDCDGVIEIFDAEAVEYSFNDGASWTTGSTRDALCEGVHPIQIRDIIGCIGTGTITVTGPPPVIADFEWGPEDANVDAPLVNFMNTSQNADHYDWDIAGLMQTVDQNTMFVFDHRDPAIYEVCMIAYNYNDCSDTICKFVDIEDVLFTYIPNAFTPDGDGLNDGFMMSTNIDVITDFQIDIYDRWGQLIFTSKDPFEPWLGNYRNGGEILNTGVYAYRITFEIKGTQARREMLGHVTLLK